MESQLQHFKDLLIQDQGIEEKVEVNQRHLIDKILARYSASHTIFRELLQNSNDANAQQAQIIFTTKEDNSLFSLPWSQKSNVVSITYKNNGQPFSETDFVRLRKIAEGNPDETKVGFFGVGFYSLFSICEEPFITSGESTMGFFWRKDMLYTKRGRLPVEAQSPWTTFYLACREPIELPDVDDFARFLATCLAFTTNLQEVEVYFNSDRVLSFHKRGQNPRPLDIPPSLYHLSSPHKLFKLESIQVSQIQLDVEISKHNTNVTLFMKIATGICKASLPKKMIEDMIRTTKKAPPQSLPIRMMLSNYEEHDSTLQTIKGSESIFEQLLPHPDRQGQVFIGFPTHQTTGCPVQIAGHFIPTVERESIDFVDKTLQGWNVEYLSMFGILARICFDAELNKIKQLLGNMVLDDESSQWFCNKVAHNLSIFHFKPSTPSPIVGKIIAEHFHRCSSNPLEMISSTGKFVPIGNLRLPITKDMSPFVKSIPALSQQFVDTCPTVIEDYKKRRMLIDITIADVLQEISNRALPEDEMVAFLKWWIASVLNRRVSRTDLQTLQRNLLYLRNGEPLSMAGIEHYTSQKLVPNDLPLPSTCLYPELSKHFQEKDLNSCFWGWKELQLLEWVAFVIKQSDFSTDPKFTERAMQTISRHFINCSNNDKSLIVSLLVSKACIVTQFGLVLPGNAYFPSVSLFEDLPKLSFEAPKSISDVFLKALGVREHVDLQLVFDRITHLSWDQSHLIKYLASIQDKLTTKEWNTLQRSSIFVAEGNEHKKRFRAEQLYSPTEKFQSLGLPLLEWQGKWKFMSDEAKFLKQLGIQTTIKFDDILVMISSSSLNKRQQLLNYFLEQFDVDYSHYNGSTVQIPFLPLEDSDALSTPSGCFTNRQVSILNLPVFRQSYKKYAVKLGVQENPSGDSIIRILRANPPSLESATQVFGYLASQQSSFDSRHWAILRQLEFIPVQENGTTRHYSPSSVYLKGEDSLFENTFTYVTFGPSGNTFLRTCGVQEQPSPTELASSIVHDPKVYLERGYDEYLNLLRMVAANFRNIRSNKSLVSKMRSSSFLIGITSIQKEGGNSQQYTLAKACDIYLIDDTVLSQLFQPLGAPIEELLEAMYAELGSKWLSHNVQISYSPNGNMSTTAQSDELQKTIQQRAPLILYDGQQTRLESELAKNALRILQDLQVRCVTSIGIIRKFQNVSKSQETSSCVVTMKGEPMLLVTRDYDYFDVASMLGNLILRKPRLNDSLLISTLLSTPLLNLTQKGFPVERILNLQSKKHTVAPPAERVHSPTVDRNEPTPMDNSKKIPVRSSQSSLDTSTVNSEKASEKRNSVISNDLFGVMKSISKSLGFSDIPDQKQQSKAPSLPGSWKGSNETIQKTIGRKPDIKPQDKQNLSKQLEKSIASVTATNQNSIKAHFPDQATQHSPVVTSYCSPLTEQDLVLVNVVNDTPVYVDKSVADEGLATILSNEDAVERFTLVLQFLAIVFDLPKEATHIYWDSDGSTVAFNRNRSLFFNFRFYLGWHYQNNSEPENAKTYYYWFMTFCHELAHNFHGPHDATHEYWMSSFAENYMGNLITTMERYGIKS